MSLKKTFDSLHFNQFTVKPIIAGSKMLTNFTCSTMSRNDFHVILDYEACLVLKGNQHIFLLHQYFYQIFITSIRELLLSCKVVVTINSEYLGGRDLPRVPKPVGVIYQVMLTKQKFRQISYFQTISNGHNAKFGINLHNLEFSYQGGSKHNK